MSKWVDFSPVNVPSNWRTKRWRVATRLGATIGVVEWRPSWRCYIFAPIEDTCYNGECLRDIAAFCEQETTNQRDAAKVQK